MRNLSISLFILIANVFFRKLLTDLKNIIAKQLPKMPKEYIVRLVFDKKHESMVITKSKIIN